MHVLNHKEILTNHLGVSAVLSVVEDVELNSHTICGKVVNKEDWTNNSCTNDDNDNNKTPKSTVIHLQISSPDFRPPSIENLHKGADFLYNMIHNENRRVYIHCKSGFGRSASMIAAYLIKYRHMNPVTARYLMSLKRRVIFKEKSAQMRQLKLFENSLTTNNKN